MDHHIKCETPGDYTFNVFNGKALEPKEPRVIYLEGIFATPAEWVMKRQPVINPLTAHAIFDYTTNSITFVEKETDHYNATIKGSLKLHPLLGKLKINCDHSYTAKELYNVLRFEGRFFTDKNAHLKLLSKLLNFSVKVTSFLEKNDDRKGNTLASKITQLQGTHDNDLNLDFSLTLEMIAGTDPETIHFTTEMDAANGEPRIYLVSDSFIERFEALKEKLFTEQLPLFAPFSIIIKK